MRVSDIKIYEDINDDELIKFVCKKKRIDYSKITSWSIYKKSIDARDKNNVHYNYTIDVFFGDEPIEKENLLNVERPKIFGKRPIIIGAGPAGLFAAYTLDPYPVPAISIPEWKLPSPNTAKRYP